MDINKADRDVSIDKLMEYHHCLKETLAEIQQTEDLNELVPRLNQLRLELQLHFEREEGPSGFGAVVRDNDPNRAGEVDRLFEEHTEFLQSIRRLQDAAKAAGGGSSHEVIGATRQLCEQILDHESRENNLLSSSMYRDIGGHG